MDKNHLRQLVAEDELRQVMKLLVSIAKNRKDSRTENEVSLQMGRLSSIENQHHANTISLEDYKLELAKIRQALLYLIDKLPDGDSDAAANKPDPAVDPQSGKPASGEPGLQASSINKPPSFWMPLGMGTFFTLVILGLVVFIPCPTSSQFGIFHIIISISAAGLAAVIPGFLEVEQKGIWRAGGALAVFALVFFGKPEKAFASDKCGGSAFSITVFVHGKEGRHQRILQNQGKVVLHLGTSPREESINEKGEATFKEIPGDFNGKKAMIAVNHAQPYQSTHPDSMFELKPNAAIYLETVLSGTDKIFGRVFGFDSGDPLDSVRVSIRKTEAFTDNHGYFELEIPTDLQAKFQKVAFEKKGYLFMQMDSIPVHTKQEIQVSLKKKK